MIDNSTGFTYDLRSLTKTGDNYVYDRPFRHVNWNYEFNICGPVNGNTICGGNNRTGICQNGTEVRKKL